MLVLAIWIVSLDLYGSESMALSNKVLIVHDELPQMEVLAKILKEKGGFEVTLVEQSALPEDWSASSSWMTGTARYSCRTGLAG